MKHFGRAGPPAGPGTAQGSLCSSQLNCFQKPDAFKGKGGKGTCEWLEDRDGLGVGERVWETLAWWRAVLLREERLPPGDLVGEDGNQFTLMGRGMCPSGWKEQQPSPEHRVFRAVAVTVQRVPSLGFPLPAQRCPSGICQGWIALEERTRREISLFPFQFCILFLSPGSMWLGLFERSRLN